MEKRIWLTGATLIDGHGGEPLENSGVLIEGKNNLCRPSQQFCCT